MVEEWSSGSLLERGCSWEKLSRGLKGVLRVGGEWVIVEGETSLMNQSLPRDLDDGLWI